jgi:hypothetical protein
VTKLVSDGCIAHAGVTLETSDVLAAHDAEYYRLIRKFLKTDTYAAEEAQEREEKKVTAARDKIAQAVIAGLHALLSLKKLPELIDVDDKIEIRLLLCHQVEVEEL